MNISTAEVSEKEVWQAARDSILKGEVWLRSVLKDFLEEFDITQQQFTILKVLREANNEPISTKEIQHYMIDKSSDTSRLVDRLIEKGLVRKRKSPEDGRLVQVFINYEGLRLLARVDDRQEELDQKFSALTVDEAEQLSFLLEKLYG